MKNLAGSKLINTFNERRLIAYLKSLRRQEGRLEEYFFCEYCNEYHWPKKETTVKYELDILEQLGILKKEKNVVIGRLKGVQK